MKIHYIAPANNIGNKISAALASSVLKYVAPCHHHRKTWQTWRTVSEKGTYKHASSAVHINDP